MFGIGTPELVVIIIVALIVIGPQKLPDLMRTVGKGLAEFKRMSSDVTRTLDREVRRAEDDLRKEEAKRELFPDSGPAPTQDSAPAQEPAQADASAKPEPAPAAGPDDKAGSKADKA